MCFNTMNFGGSHIQLGSKISLAPHSGITSGRLEGQQDARNQTQVSQGKSPAPSAISLSHFTSMNFLFKIFLYILFEVIFQFCFHSVNIIKLCCFEILISEIDSSDVLWVHQRF